MVAKKTAPAGKAASKSTPGEPAAPAKDTTAAASTGTAARNPAKNATARAPAKTAAAKTAARKAAPAEKAVPAKKTGASTVALKKTPGGASSASKDAAAAANALPKARGAADPGELAVRPGEEPWTPEEVAEARTGLGADAERLRAEILASEAAITGLMRDSGDGAGDDQADTGTKNITREHELALASSARERLLQTERALERLDAGTYGLCESCGRPIGKARMQAFPRATLCVECKQRQERR
ncbi:TraR/DksA family transcriptional regulator [Streptomyces sp. NPDC018031]|uniref:TraR/DksA family transcriptional regulator n=1 Tax=Streptomyces sp. NPDC018031 TaxID=3365033 RepID=UPI0037B5FAE5